MNKKLWIILGVVVFLILAGIFIYMLTHICFGCGESYCWEKQKNMASATKYLKIILDEQKSAIYLGANPLAIKAGDSCDLAFIYQNINTGNDKSNFSYALKLDDPHLNLTCPEISPQEIESWIYFNRSKSFSQLSGGENKIESLKIAIPSGTPRCIFRLSLEIYADEKLYDKKSLNLEVLNN